MEPKVSVILVNYNGDADTLDCISSLENVTYSNLECIVVDNASSTQEELEKELPQWVVYIKSPVNLGFSGGNNIGIDYALRHAADYIILLNNDTVVEPDFVTELIVAANRHGDAGILTGKIVYYSSPEYIWYAGGYMNLNLSRIHHEHIGEKDDFSDNERSVSFATGCLMMIPVEAINKVGVLNEDFFMYSEDAEYCSRMIKSGYKIWYVPNAKIFHKVSKSSGGAGSKLSQYYRTRNEMYLVAHNAEHKIIGCLCCIIRLLKRLLVGQFTFRCVRDGLKDCFYLKMGKSERF